MCSSFHRGFPQTVRLQQWFPFVAASDFSSFLELPIDQMVASYTTNYKRKYSRFVIDLQNRY